MQRGDRILLSWSVPPLTTEGQNVLPEKLGPANIFRAILPGLRKEVAQAEFEAAARPLAAVPAAQGEYADTEAAAQAGSTAAYALQLTNRKGDSAGLSNIVVVPVLPALAAPAGLRARTTEKAVVLEWTPVPGANAYAIYKAEGDGPAAPAGRAEKPAFSDPAFQFDQQYRYTVRAIAERDGFAAESADSAPVSLKPADEFPPAVPSQVVAVPVPAPPSVELSWELNSEPDFAGYNLYRSESGGAYRRLNAEPLVSPTYRDTAVKPGVEYSYAVAAFDRKGNESARSEPVPVRINAP